MPRDRGAAFRQIDRAKLRMADEVLVARLELRERFVRRKRGRRPFRGARRQRVRAEPERDCPRRAELDEISPADSFVAAIDAHRRSSLRLTAPASFIFKYRRETEL